MDEGQLSKFMKKYEGFGKLNAIDTMSKGEQKNNNFYLNSILQEWVKSNQDSVIC